MISILKNRPHHANKQDAVLRRVMSRFIFLEKLTLLKQENSCFWMLSFSYKDSTSDDSNWDDYVASAVDDIWADPESEYLSCVAASEVYEKLAVEGFIFPARLPEIGDVLHNGKIGYHLRKGDHYLSREDWLYFMRFLVSQP